MMELWNTMKGAASAVSQQIGQNRWGLVTSVRRSDTGYMAKVRMQPEDVQSGWLPVLSTMVGGGWGLVSPPEPGMQAFIASDSGDGHHGVIVGMAYSLSAMPPVPPAAFSANGTPDKTPVGPGEMALVSKSGAVIRLCSDGTIHIKGDVRIDGNLIVQNAITANTGDITAAAANVVAAKGDVSDKHGSVDRLRGNFNVHHHATGPLPTPQDPE